MVVDPWRIVVVGLHLLRFRPTHPAGRPPTSLLTPLLRLRERKGLPPSLWDRRAAMEETGLSHREKG